MKIFARYLILLFVFWMLLFAMQRGVFLWYNQEELVGIQGGEIARAFVVGLRMDMATAGFLMALPLVLMVIALFVKRRIFPKMANLLTVLGILAVVCIGLLDTGLYSNWGSKINSKALFYALFPSEGIRAVGAVPIWLFVTLTVVQLAVFIIIYLRWLKARVPGPRKIWLAIVVSVLLMGAMPLLFRGGFQKYPLGKNEVYYSRYPVLNYAALNSGWNFMNALAGSARMENPYVFFKKEEARQYCEEIAIAPCDSTRMIVKTARPNIVLIMMESISADNMQGFGSKEAIMPGLDSLCDEGLLFSRFYASGFRTEQGLIAFLSGFPAQPTVTIQREFGKFEKLPSLPRTLDDAGYTCNYYYSGDLNFANTSAYLNASAFTKLLDRDAREWQRTTEWGVLDEELFACHLREASSDATPFFSVIMTTTNHEPFDAPVATHFTGGEVAQYKNTAHYTDSCLFAYIQQAKLQPWYDNTLFIISSDHAHFYPENRGKSEPERHHIPFLLLGGALRDAYRGSVNDVPASQVDLASLLLNQLQLPDTAFAWSRNPLNPCCPGYAFYSFDNGFGWITATETVVYDHDQKRIIFPVGDSIPTPHCVRQGKAYLQMVYDEYLGK